MEELQYEDIIKLMSTNIVYTRRLDELGRIVIPIDYRNELGFVEGADISIRAINDCIILKLAKENESVATRKLDELGRIVIQKEFRMEYSWNEKDILQIYLHKDMIILKKYENKCIFCFKEKHLEDFKGKKICNSCKQQISKN